MSILYDHVELDPEREQEFLDLCASGDLSSVKGFLAQNDIHVDFPMFMLLCANNELTLIKWLVDEYSLFLPSEDVFLGFWSAIKSGYSELAWYLSDTFNLADAVFENEQYKELFALSSDSTRTKEARRIVQQFRITAESARASGVSEEQAAMISDELQSRLDNVHICAE